MHNCKSTRRSLIELAMNELPPASATQMLTELKNCAACQEEYFSLRSLLRVSDQALRSALPGESFWAGYHARLSARLSDGLESYSSVQPVEFSAASRLWRGLRQMARASIRIPVPAAAALILLIGVSGLFAVRPRGPVSAITPAQSQAAPPAPLVVTRTVEVPVVHEKVFTRVVYVEKARRGSPGSEQPLQRGERPKVANRGANTGANAEGTTAVSLIGFKPTEQVKLKVVKGSYRDEK